MKDNDSDALLDDLSELSGVICAFANKWGYLATIQALNSNQFGLAQSHVEQITATEKSNHDDPRP